MIQSPPPGWPRRGALRYNLARTLAAGPLLVTRRRGRVCREMKPTIPPDEAARLEALRRYEILDTTAEESFDELTRLAAQICCAPVALISLVDDERQWFKSRTGFGAVETPRDVAFCAHAILSPDLFVVTDAAADARFAANPLVTADPRI